MPKSFKESQPDNEVVDLTATKPYEQTPADYFFNALPPDAQEKVVDICNLNGLTLEAYFATAIQQATQTPGANDNILHSPFLVDAQHSLASAGGSNVYQLPARKEVPCEVCGTLFAVKRAGQRFCPNSVCQAHGAGMMTAEERERKDFEDRQRARQFPGGQSEDSQRLSVLEANMQQMMGMIQQLLQQRAA